MTRYHGNLVEKVAARLAALQRRDRLLHARFEDVGVAAAGEHRLLERPLAARGTPEPEARSTADDEHDGEADDRGAQPGRLQRALRRRSRPSARRTRPPRQNPPAPAARPHAGPTPSSASIPGRQRAARRRSQRLLPADHDFDAAVARPPLLRGIGGDRVLRALAFHRNARRVGELRPDQPGDGLRARHRQVVVRLEDARPAGLQIVGVADDADRARLAVERKADPCPRPARTTASSPPCPLRTGRGYRPR